LVDEIRDTIIEGTCQSRMILLESYHRVGEIISSHRDVSIKRLAQATRYSVLSLERCVKFYTKYPDLTKLPEGKNTSWHKMVNKYLIDNPKPEELIEWITCPTCRGTGKVKNGGDKN
jgi:hypothetical protein